MDDPLRVSPAEGLGDRLAELDRVPDRERPLRDALAERSAAHVGHDEVGDVAFNTEGEQAHDLRMFA